MKDGNNRQPVTPRHGRREILASLIAGLGVCTAPNLFLEPSEVAAMARTEPQTEGVNTESVHFQSGVFDVQAYLAWPKAEGTHPGVLLIHDNRGLNEHYQDVARRFAAEGFVAIAPDLLSRAGGTSKVTAAAAAAAIKQLPSGETVDDVKAGFDFFEKYPAADPAKISSVGFGWGGWRSFMLATTESTLHRAVIFCGSTPTTGLENIRAPIMAQYAQYDFRTTGIAIPTQKQMAEFGEKFTYYVYPGVGNGFFDDTGPRYDAAAADLAWNRTLEFLRSSG